MDSARHSLPRRSCSRLLVTPLLCLTILVAQLGAAAAETPSRVPVANLEVDSIQRGSPFDVHLASDLPITVVGLLAMFRPDLFTGELTVRRPHYAGMSNRVNALDRSVIGNHSSSARHLSDGMLYATTALPFVASIIEAFSSPDGLEGLGKDTLVLAEVAAVTGMVCTIVKYSVRRARPYTYAAGADPSDPHRTNDTLSFFSGHTAQSFAMATAYSYLFTQRHRGSPMVLPVWLTTHAMALTTAVMRVSAGKHFWSDVIVGAVVGSGIGLLVPWLHRRIFKGRSLLDESNPLYSLRIAPTFHRGGFGLSAMTFW